MHTPESEAEVPRLIRDAFGGSSLSISPLSSDDGDEIDTGLRAEHCTCGQSVVSAKPDGVVEGLYLFANGLCSSCVDKTMKDILELGVVMGDYNQAMRFGSFPTWALRSLERGQELLRSTSAFHSDLRSFLDRRPMFNQVIVNKYEPGEGIRSHVDLEAFADGILSISLGSTCMMTFQHKDMDMKKEIFLRGGDVMFMCGPARHDWKHGIPSRISDLWQGREMVRALRISLTFRKMKDDVHTLRQEAPAT